MRAPGVLQYWISCSAHCSLRVASPKNHGRKGTRASKEVFQKCTKRQTYARRDANESQRVAEFSRKAATKAGKLQEVAAKQRLAAERELDQEMRIVRQEVFGSSEESSEANNELARTLQKIQEMSEEESRKCRRRLEKMQTKFKENNDEQEDKILGAQLTDFTNDDGLPH